MKPDVGEQLQGTCRILEQVVAPCVTDPFARTILDNLVANLRMLTGALPAVAPFLRADNQVTVRLLATLQPVLPAELSNRIGETLMRPEPDVADSAALDARNTAVRVILAESICSPGLAPAHHEAIRRHLSNRAAQAPMRYVSTLVTKPVDNLSNGTP